MTSPRTPTPPPSTTPWWRRALLLIGFASAAFVLSRLELRAMASAVREVSLATIAVACVAMWLNMIVKSVRWHRMLAHRGVALPASFVSLVFFEAMAWGCLTLGRAGELFRAPPLVDRGVPLRAAMASILLDRVLDLAFLVAVGFASLAWVNGQPWGSYAVGAASVGGLVVLGALGNKRDLVGEVPTSKLKLAIEEGRAFFFPAALAESSVWTAVSWAFSFAIVVVLAADIAPQAQVASLLAAAFISSLSTLLPITYQGIGTREPIFAAILARDGVAPERAVLLALLVFTANFCAVMVLGLAAAAIRRRSPS